MIPKCLDAVDLELHSCIQARARGWSAPEGAKDAPPDLGSAMPWCAVTTAQWDRDLAKTRREVMTSACAAAFSARRDDGRLPLSQQLSRSSSPASKSSSSSPSFAASIAERWGDGAAGPEMTVSWADDGGVSRINGFFGKLEEGTATLMCMPLAHVTADFTIGRAQEKKKKSTFNC